MVHCPATARRRSGEGCHGTILLGGRSGPLGAVRGRLGALWASMGCGVALLGAMDRYGLLCATAHRWVTLGFWAPLRPLGGGGAGESSGRIRPRSTYTIAFTTDFHELQSNGLWLQLC